MKLNLNVEKKTILTLAVITLTTLGIIGGIIFPALYYIKNLEKETNEIRQYMEKKHQNTRSLSDSKQKIEEIQSMISTFQDYLFFRGNELELITLLENLATNNKVTQRINSSNLDQPASNIINFSITINGDYLDTIHYLRALEQQKYFIHIRKLNISSGFSIQNKNPNATVMNVELSLYAHKR